MVRTKTFQISTSNNWLNTDESPQALSEPTDCTNFFRVSCVSLRICGSSVKDLPRQLSLGAKNAENALGVLCTDDDDMKLSRKTTQIW